MGWLWGWLWVGYGLVMGLVGGPTPPGRRSPYDAQMRGCSRRSPRWPRRWAVRLRRPCGAQYSGKGSAQLGLAALRGTGGGRCGRLGIRAARGCGATYRHGGASPKLPSSFSSSAAPGCSVGRAGGGGGGECGVTAVGTAGLHRPARPAATALHPHSRLSVGLGPPPWDPFGMAHKDGTPPPWDPRMAHEDATPPPLDPHWTPLGWHLGLGPPQNGT